ncbi:MAG TPA: SDR family NAD(P)-dependent oxidoreductase [Candidatus Binatia bacterium]|nr:SDR family NAD(P)-dependent oxidoreductase [Candidatus Binatia bacterium]
MKLQGKVALMAGCSPNINAGIALELAAAGATVACVDIEPSYAKACASAIEHAGGAAAGIVADVTNEEQVVAALARVEEAFGGVDVLVNGAVVQYRFGLLDMPLERFRRQIDVILTGTFLFTKHAARQMIRLSRRGSIINIISTEGHQGNLGNIGYGTAKSGLLNFTRAAAMELARHGIRVNSLTPTATDSAEGKRRTADWGLAWQEPELGPRPGFTAGDQGVPLGHRPRPSDYGKAAVFLASDDAEMITGIDLRVDGGTIAKYWRWNPGVA